MSGRRCVIWLALVLPLLQAATATATTRYVTPGGTSTGTCDGSVGNPPCEIGHAFSLQQNRDDYVIGPGTYDTGVLLAGNDLDVHGVQGEAGPRIVSSGNTLAVFGSGDRISDLEIATTASQGDAIADPGGGSFEDVAIVATGPNGEGNVAALVTGASAALLNSTISIDETDNAGGAIQVDGGSAAVSHSPLPAVTDAGGSITVTESLIVDDTGTAINVLEPGVVRLRNDTVISTALGGDAINADATSGGATVIATNVIPVSGTSGVALNASSGHTIDVDHSNFSSRAGSVNDLGGNVGATPQFVNPASDFHLRPTSPAIDSGTSAGIPVSKTDLDGHPRVPPKSVDCRQQVDMGA